MKMSDNISSYIIAFVVLFLGFQVQTFLIYPVESLLRPDGYVNFASLVFIPHGIKIILIMLIGPVIWPVIYLAQLLSGFIYSGDFTASLFTSGFGTFAVVVPAVLLNASLKRSIWAAPVFYRDINISIIWTYISLSVMGSFFNSLLNAMYFGINDLLLPYLYFSGDVFGSLVVFVVLLSVVRPILMKIKIL